MAGPDKPQTPHYPISPEKAASIIHTFTPTYTLVRLLGKGAYGHVFLLKDELKQVAVKILPVKLREIEGETAEQTRHKNKKLSYEWAFLKSNISELNHPSLVSIHDYFHYEETDATSKVAAYGVIYMDYWPTNLIAYVRQQFARKRFTTVRKFAVLTSLAELLQRLRQDKNLLVVDLKIGNILVREGGSTSVSLAITDFGGIFRAGNSSIRRVESTAVYLAPELHKNAQKEIDETALIYSFGLLAFYVLEGRELFQDNGSREPAYMELRKRGPDWSGDTTNTENELRSIVTRCLAELRQERYASFAALANHLRETRGKRMQGPQAQLAADTSTWVEENTGMSFVKLAGGHFHMGQSEYERDYLQDIYSSDHYASRFARELPRHETAVGAFWLARYPVTCAEFARFVEDTLYQTDAEKEGWGFALVDKQWTEREGQSWRSPEFEQSDKHPVVCVSWFDATAFVEWLSLRTGLQCSLPTEAQWEYACRADSAAAFHFGETLHAQQANFDARTMLVEGQLVEGQAADYRGHTTPVGSFPANAFGLFDMHGNVWEWCLDTLDDKFYEQPPALLADPLCQTETGVRVRRGGSWSFDPIYLRAAYRGKNYPDARYSDIGFRVAIKIS